MRIFIIFLFSFPPVFGQILNTDGLGRPVDSTKVFNAMLDFGLTINKQNSLLIAMDTKAELSYWHKNSSLIFSSNFALFRTGSQNLLNGGYAHLRFRMRQNKLIQPEFSAQYQLDNIRGMKERILAGAKLRFRMIEKTKVSLFSAIGVMYEFEKWDYSGIRPEFSFIGDTIYNHYIKVNSYVSYRQIINDFATLNVVVYYQARPDRYFILPRISFDAQLNFKFTKHISFAVKTNVFYDAAPPVPTYNLYYSVVNKIIFSF